MKFVDTPNFIMCESSGRKSFLCFKTMNMKRRCDKDKRRASGKIYGMLEIV